MYTFFFFYFLNPYDSKNQLVLFSIAFDSFMNSDTPYLKDDLEPAKMIVLAIKIYRINVSVTMPKQAQGENGSGTDGSKSQKVRFQYL